MKISHSAQNYIYSKFKFNKRFVIKQIIDEILFKLTILQNIYFTFNLLSCQELLLEQNNLRVLKNLGIN
ncbi:MAG: hypothetical protein HW421_715 [Ignavibacteria bacterium]|nr:hypothetical protein [Ignavibacteria bacterium]